MGEGVVPAHGGMCGGGGGGGGGGGVGRGGRLRRGESGDFQLGGLKHGRGEEGEGESSNLKVGTDYKEVMRRKERGRRVVEKVGEGAEMVLGDCSFVFPLSFRVADGLRRSSYATCRI